MLSVEQRDPSDFYSGAQSAAASFALETVTRSRPVMLLHPLICPTYS